MFGPMITTQTKVTFVTGILFCRVKSDRSKAVEGVKLNECSGDGTLKRKVKSEWKNAQLLISGVDLYSLS